MEINTSFNRRKLLTLACLVGASALTTPSFAQEGSPPAEHIIIPDSPIRFGERWIGADEGLRIHYFDPLPVEEPPSGLKHENQP